MKTYSLPCLSLSRGSENLTFEVDYLQKFDFFKKCYLGSLLGPPKEFFDEIKKGSTIL